MAGEVPEPVGGHLLHVAPGLRGGFTRSGGERGKAKHSNEQRRSSDDQRRRSGDQGESAAGENGQESGGTNGGRGDKGERSTQYGSAVWSAGEYPNRRH